MATYAYERIANETLLEMITGDGAMVKRAKDAIDSFTRLRVREDGVHRRVQTYVQLGNDDLDRDLTDKPVKYVDKEPDGPPAVMVAFANLPLNVYIKGPRYRVLFGRIQSPRFTKDVDELRTWYMDIRQVLSDNMIKDMLAEEDSKFFDACKVAMGGAADATSPLVGGSVTWKTISGGLTRDGVRDAFKVLPSTFAHLEVNTVVINNVSIQELMKWGRDEMGGDFSQDVMMDGWSKKKFMNADWILTIKRDLVPDDSLYHFAHEKFLGKAYALEDTTMVIDRYGPMLEFWAYESIGSAIANSAAVGRTDH